MRQKIPVVLLDLRVKVPHSIPKEQGLGDILNIIQNRLVILINQDDHLLVILLRGLFDEFCETLVGILFLHASNIKPHLIVIHDIE